MKRLGMIAFILALVLCFAMPASAIKILPYSVPLEDMMRWDKSDNTLKLSNNEGESLSVAWPSTVDLWNYDGDYWHYDLPTGDEFSFKKAVNIGYAGAVITYTEGEPILEVRGTCAGTSGSVNAMPVYVHSILAGAGQVGRAGEYVLAPTAQMGSWGNALKGYLVLTGASGSIGLLSGICAEILLPDETMTGTLAAMEWELVAPTSFVPNEGVGSNCVSFLYARASGAAVTEIDDHGYFMNLQGLTPGVGSLLSEGYVTLKCGVGTHTKYLVMSRIEDGLSMGALGSELTLNDDSPLFRLYTTAAEAGAVGIQSALIRQVNTQASNTNEIEAFKVQLISDVKTGAWANVIFAQLDYVEDGLAHGTGSVYAAELSMPSVTQVIRGEYALFQMDLDLPTGCDLGGNPIALFKVNVWGGAETEFDDHGLLLDIESGSVTSGALDFYYENAVAFNNCDAFLKIRVGTTFYYIPLSDNQGGT